MSLSDWAKNGWLRSHKPSKEEISNLLEIVECDSKDATAKGLSEDWKFGIAYNADYLDTCRKKRNETEYDFAGNVSEDEAEELMNFCDELKTEVIAWLKKNHRNLV